MKTLPTDYQSFIAVSRYARYLDTEKRRETWDETVTRYFDFMQDHLLEAHNYTLEPSLKTALTDAVLSLEIMPSMRALMTAGPALKRDNTCAYNCSYLPINSPRSFDELFYILLCGTGVGYSVERQYIADLPAVSEHFEKSTSVLVVDDSKAGWARAFKELVALLYTGQVPSWDVSKVRPAGARLKTFGGRASGPGPLVDLFNYTVGLFKAAAGRKLNSLECHDLCCKIASVVVVGGVRRSAMISLSNLSDQRMRDAKSGSWYVGSPDRAFANNSVAYTEKPDMGTFMKEWESLYSSKSGERGMFYRNAAVAQATKNGRRESAEFGVNPCLHPDTEVQTIYGAIKIKDITKPTKVYTMDALGRLSIRNASAAWISKKDAETVVVKYSSGKSLVCTPDHPIYVESKGYTEARNLKKGDRLVHLVRNRRGAAYSGVKLTSQGKRAYTMEHRLVWESVFGEIPKYHDIHHKDGDTYNNSIDNLECLHHDDHATITALEQPNNHQVWGPDGRYTSPPTSRKGKKTIVPVPDQLKSNLHQYATVLEVSPGPTTDVYDLTVEGTHNFIANFIVVHNCGEIILRPFQFCNLTEVVVRANDTPESLARKVRLATILGTFQSTLTNFKYLRKVWKDNTEQERLLGVSLTGTMDHKVLSGKGDCGDVNLPTLLTNLKNVAVVTNEEFAMYLGINQSVAVTTQKPSGTVSQLVNSASGFHPRYAKYYIRRVRGDNKDPLTQFMKNKGVPCEPCNYSAENTSVFSFPIKADEGTKVFRETYSAIEQLELWKIYKTYWAEHNISVTIQVKEPEWMEVGAWVYKHFNDIVGVSFLPYDTGSYTQAPYEEIDEATYKALDNAMPKDIQWDQLAEFEAEDTTVAAQNYACSGDVCEVVDIGKK